MPERRDHEDYPLGGNQRRYLLAERFTVASYMIAVVHRIEGPLDLRRLEHAARALVARHDALRSRFRVVDGEYRVRVDPEPAFAFTVLDVPDDAFETFRRAALPLVMNDIDVGVPASLVRFIVGRVDGGTSWRVCFAAHHAVSDGVSRSLAMKQLFQLYDGRDLPTCRSFYEFVDAGTPSADDESFWHEQASLAPFDLSVQPDRASMDDSMLGEFVVGRLGISGAEFRKLAGRTPASKFACLAAAYAVGLMRMTGRDRILFTFQSAGRATVAAPMSVFGPFSNTLPLVAEVRPAESFAALAERLQQQITLAVAHEAVPFDTILKTLPDKPIFSLNLFPKELPPTAEGLRIGPREFLDRQTEYTLNLVWSEDGTDFNGRAYYDATRFSAERIAGFLEAQTTILRTALQQPVASIRDLLATLGGQTLPLSPEFQVPPALTVVDRFVAQAEARPDAEAIRTTGVTWSYGELLRRADGWADLLLHCGIQPGDRVVLVANRSSDLVAAVLGVARAGGSFAVIEATYPYSRIREQIHQLRALYGIILDRGHDALRDDDPDVKWLDPFGAPVPRAARYPGPAEGLPLYFLFTSGTTGAPKCVGHGTEILTFYTTWERETFSITEKDCISMLSGLNHDPVMRDLFVPLASGATLAIPSDHEAADPRKLRKFLRDARVTVIHLTPPLGQLLAMEAEPDALAGIRLIVWGGDELPGYQARRTRVLAPLATQVNLYGTSETSQAAAIFILKPAEEIHWPTVPVGKSVPWMRCECVTADGRVCGRGEAGQLRVTMPFPVFVVDPDETGERTDQGLQERTVQLTGDRATVLQDDNLMFAGRLDDQVKIRGYRVELGEVASALRSLRGIDQAIALLVRRGEERSALFAFCVPSGAAPLAPSELRNELLRKLPSYMVPEHIRLLETMPLLANGKLDRKALLDLAINEENVSPATPGKARAFTAAERELAGILAKVLRRPVADLEVNLYELGADSLSMIEVRLALEEAGYQLPDGWEALPIIQLVEFARGGTSRHPQWLRTSSVESFIAIRAVAICMVVGLHFKLFVYDGGATSALFVIAGIIFTRYTLHKVLSDDSSLPAWIFLLKIIVASYPIIVLIAFLRFLRNKPVYYESLTFTANFLNYPEGDDGFYFMWQWYIHCYIQIIFIFTFILSFSVVRSLFRADAFRSALAGTALSAALFALTALWFSTWLGGTAPSLRWMPSHGMMLVFLGMALTSARTAGNLTFVLAVALLVLALRAILIEGVDVAVAAASILFLAFIPLVTVPASIGRLMATISSASLFIYLLHLPLRGLASRFVDLQQQPLLSTIGTIAASVALWKLWYPVVQGIVAWIAGQATLRAAVDNPAEQGI